MVKLSNSIGATNIAQSTRLVTPLSNSLFEITHSEFADNESMMRFFPFTDLEYNSAEAAARDNIIASARVPVVAHISAPGASLDAIRAPPKLYGRSAINGIVGKDASKLDESLKKQLEYLLTGVGAADFILGVSPSESAASVASSGNTAKDVTLFKKREAMWSPKNEVSQTATATQARKAKAGEFIWEDSLVAGTTGPQIEIIQCLTEDQAIEAVSSDVRLRTIAYVIGPRDVQLYFSDSVIGGMVRRLRHLVERYGPCNPHHWPMGLGHLAYASKVDKDRAQATPATSQLKKGGRGEKRKGSRRRDTSKLKVAKPTWGWSAGAVGWKSGSMPASGQLYMPDDYVPFAKRKRAYKYNHLMTQIGAELVDCLQAVGIEMNSDLSCFSSSDKIAAASTEVISMLQVMYSDPLMFGTTDNPEVSDATFDEGALTTAVKSMMGMFFDSAHTHVDPGVMSFMRNGSSKLRSYTGDDGYLSDTITTDLCWKNAPISPAGLMREFISRYIVFLLVAAAMKPYFKVNVFPMHLLYYGGPKPELVTEQLLMNFRPDWDFGGSSGLPFSLIPTRLNPGEVAVRIPTLFDSSDNFNMKTQGNLWLGPREPVVFQDVEEIRFRGDKPQSVIEKESYYFSPIVEADSFVSGTYRNHRNVTIAHLSRPAYFTPGCSGLGWILGTMSDNSRVQGPQYLLPGTLGYSNEADYSFKTTDVPLVYRPMVNSIKRDESIPLEDWPTQDAQSTEAQLKMADTLEARAIKPSENRQTVGEKGGGKLKNASDMAAIVPESLGGSGPTRDNSD